MEAFFTELPALMLTILFYFWPKWPTLELEGRGKKALMSLKIGLRLPFEPNSLVEFEHFDQKIFGQT